jgi:hypothetical protein
LDCEVDQLAGGSSVGKLPIVLTALLEMKQPQVARLKRGDVSPMLETLMRLADALDIEFKIDVRPANRRTRLVTERARTTPSCLTRPTAPSHLSPPSDGRSFASTLAASIMAFAGAARPLAERAQVAAVLARDAAARQDRCLGSNLGSNLSGTQSNSDARDPMNPGVSH